MAQDSPAEGTPDFLISGKDYLKAHPGFKLIGRKDELNAAFDVLLRKSTGDNLVLYGPQGVGLSSIIMGLQTSKDDPATPFDIVGKKFYYLDVDAMFSSTNQELVNQGFQKAMDQLGSDKDSDSVLIIEDTKGFLDGIKNSGTQNIVNALMHASRTNPHFQIIFSAGLDSVSDLLNAHAEINSFVLQDVDKPTKDDQRAIVENAAKGMEQLYGVTISPKAVDTVLELTQKYNLRGFPAQPKGAIVLLEGALTAYRRTANARAPELDGLEKTLADVTAALAANKPAEGELADKSPDELAAIQLETENTIKEVTEGWGTRQEEIHKLYTEQVSAEEAIQAIDDEIARLKGKEATKAADEKTARTQFAAATEAKDESAQQKILDTYKGKYSEELVISNEEEASGIDRRVVSAGASEEVRRYLEERKPFENILAKSRATYKELTQNSNDDLTLTDANVLAEFSRLSGVDVNKLKQDDTQKLLNLAETLEQRVFGQPEPLEGLANAVINAKAGMKPKDRAIGNFLFLGPTGTGKTETALTLAEALFGDEDALQKYEMEHYQESNAITQLIGAPQGYMGHEEGGQLVNNMKARPECVNLFDEIEKAHKDIISGAFLGITDTKKAFITDRRTGEKVSFANAVNIFTSNIGQKYFLDPTLSPEEARKKALYELEHHEKFTPEFLGRLTIYCFDKLEQKEIVKIAEKNLRELNDLAADRGISLTMPVEDIKRMCLDVYNPRTGARSPLKYIDSKISPQISRIIFNHQGVPGDVKITYIPGKISDEEKARIRDEIENEEEYDIRQEVENDKRLLSRLVRQISCETPDLGAVDKEQMRGKLQEALDTEVNERIEERIAEKIKGQEIENSVVSAEFVPEGAAPSAANTNIKPAAAPAAKVAKSAAAAPGK